MAMSKEANDLHLYIVNDGDLNRQILLPAQKNATRRKAKGTFNSTLALKLFKYTVEAGAKKYAKEMGGGPWHKQFSMSDRKAVAKELVDDFESKYEDGEFDEYIPKKYRKKK